MAAPEAPHAPVPNEARRPRRGTCLGVAVVLAVLLAALVLAAMVGLWSWRPLGPHLTEETVERTVVTTVQREAAASFLVTGVLEVAATSTVRNTEVFLPGLLDWPLGTAESTVRVPGRVYYGFDVEQLEGGAVEVGPEGVVTVRLPELRVQSVEPELRRMEVQTSAGWTRLHDDAARRVERAAIRRVQQGLEAQGAQHLRTATQPRINTARALEAMLRPAFEAAGFDDVRLRIRIDEQLVLEPPSG